MTDTMTCMNCGVTKQWPGAFPNTMEARCWECAWKQHLREKHPKVVRRARRAAEKRAALRIRNEEHAAAEVLLRADGWLPGGPSNG